MCTYARKVPVTFRQSSSSARSFVAMRASCSASLAQLLHLPCSNHMLLHGPFSCRGHTVAVYLQNFIRPVWHFLEADVLLGSQALR
jgi:hypothetical protein